MSDSPQGEGWWIASDGKWYPPESAQPQPPQQQPPHSPQQPAQPTESQPTAQQPPPAPGQAGQQPPPAPGQAGQQPPPAPGQAGQQPPPFAGAPGAPAGAPAAAGAPGAPGQPPGMGDGTGDEQGKSRKGLWIALVVILLLVAAGIAAFFIFGGDDDSEGDGDDTEQDTDIGDATGDVVNDGPIEFNTDYTTTLEGDRTEARYTLDAPDGAIMTVQVANERESQASVRAIYETPEKRFADLSVNPGASDSGEVITAAGDAATFELVFTGGPAKFDFRVDLAIQDDAGQGGDAGAELSDAFEISGGQGVAGLLGGEDAIDHYTVEVDPGTAFRFEGAVPDDAEQAVRFVVEFDGGRLIDESVQPGQDTEATLLLADTDSGTMEVITSGGEGDYTFTAGFDEVTDGGETGDAPGELADARTVDPSGPIDGSVGDLDKGDYYLFAAPGASFGIVASSDSSSERAYRLIVEDAQGKRVGDIQVQPGAQMSETIELETTGEVRMQITGGRASYSIEVG